MVWLLGDKMIWPQELIDKFDAGFENVEMRPEYATKIEAIRYFLDIIARMAVWRCNDNAEKLSSAYFWPYTPIGEFTGGFRNAFTKFSLGKNWHEAIDCLKEFVENNSELIVNEYKDKHVKYDDRDLWP